MKGCLTVFFFISSAQTFSPEIVFDFCFNETKPENLHLRVSELDPRIFSSPFPSLYSVKTCNLNPVSILHGFVPVLYLHDLMMCFTTQSSLKSCLLENVYDVHFSKIS